ncbi:MerR family transcriptional regulator [Niallia sp. FSL R7-0271]|uniref:MerR family transcriptional regulator n=1 Tax=Niallia sp. FSL R7-0271 TaxID=2921678 RepID=UPI0030F55F66
MNYWKISDFTEQIKLAFENEKIHMNTIDGWFKALESKRIHYIMRTEDTKEKVYDELDLKIAIFIKKRREDKWSLAAIHEDLGNHFELRGFPTNEVGPVAFDGDLESLKEQLSEELKITFNQMAATQIEEIKKHYDSIIEQIPKLPSPEEQKETRFQEMVVRRRVEAALENEAIELWSTKPESERLKKVGLFRKEEDFNKRYEFIRSYINENYEKRLKKEFGL